MRRSRRRREGTTHLHTNPAAGNPVPIPSHDGRNARARFGRWARVELADASWVFGQAAALNSGRLTMFKNALPAVFSSIYQADRIAPELAGVLWNCG